MKNNPAKVYREYMQGISYNSAIDLGETVERNEDFFIGKQWRGLESVRELDKTVVNFLGRVVGYFVSTITTDKISADISLFNTLKSESEGVVKIINAQLAQAIEWCELDAQAKRFVRNAAVRGDAAAHIYFDTAAESGQAAKGLVAVEALSNLDVFFGDRQQSDPQKQPYIIIASRRPIAEVKKLVSGDKRERVQADNGDGTLSERAQKDDSARVTVLTKYYRKNGSIWRYQCCKDVEISPDADMGYKRYPIAWWPWEDVMDSYHGQAAISMLIPNQIAINKAYAMALKQQRDLAFPKILYNGNVFPDGYPNRIGAVEVNGDPREAATVVSGGADIPASVFTMIQNLAADTRDAMGASDAALGNVNPDNTSAIIAVQQATAVPLELKKRGFEDFCESIIRSMLDIIIADYGERDIVVADELGNEQMVRFNFEMLADKVVKLKIDVGGVAYWTPDLQAKQMENLLTGGIIKKRSQFIENLPDGILANKQKLLAEIKREEEQENAMQQMQSGNAGFAQGGGNPDMALPQM